MTLTISAIFILATVTITDARVICLCRVYSDCPPLPLDIPWNSWNINEFTQFLMAVVSYGTLRIPMWCGWHDPVWILIDNYTSSHVHPYPLDPYPRRSLPYSILTPFDPYPLKRYPTALNLSQLCGLPVSNTISCDPWRSQYFVSSDLYLFSILCSVCQWSVLFTLTTDCSH